MDDDAFGDLVEESFQLAELAQHPGWRYVHQNLARVLESHKGQVLGGRFDDLAEYKFIAGEVRGIERVLDLPAAVAKKVKAEQERRSG
jgi:hypothetical protein